MQKKDYSNPKATDWYYEMIADLSKIPFSFVYSGKEYKGFLQAHFALQKKEIQTVAMSLYTFTGPLGSKYNLICAGVIITLLPALIIFILFQKQIYSGLTAGAVKG